MANKFQVKRTAVSARTPNTTNSGNTHYIDTGELALNLTDGKMFSSNGSAYFEVGANLANQTVSGTANVGKLNVTASSGDEGGEIFLAAPANTTLGGGITIDAYQNKIRFFEQGGNARGAFIDLTACANGAGTNLLTGGVGGSGTVTQVNTGIGLTGGPITSNGTVDVLANTGIIANATGLYVNSSYIATISSNNSSFLGGTAAASYVQNTDSRTLSGNLVISGTYFNPSANTILLGNSTQRWVLNANTGSFSGDVSGITTLAAGNTTITGFANVTSTIQGGSSLSIAGALSGVTTAAMGNTTVTGFANATVSVNSALLTVGTSFIANTTGAYHTGTVNTASYTVGSSFIANSTAIVGTGFANISTSVNSALLTVGTSFIANTIGAYHTGTINAASFTTTGFTANTTGTYPTSNSSGSALGTSTQRWVINANTINASGLITATSGANIQGTANLVDVNISGNLTVSGTTTYVNTTNLNVGDNIVTLNADLPGATAPTENAGLEVNRGSSANVNFLWNETSDSWTLGNTDITGYANASVSVNSALLTVGTSFIANTTGAYHTGTINSASYTIGSNFSANSTVVTTSDQIISTRTGSATDANGQIFLNGGTSNRIDWAATGVGAPTVATRSSGTKLVLYPAVAAASVDFGMGIDTNVLWSSVADTGDTFKWYANTTELFAANTLGITVGSGGIFPTSNSSATSLGSATQRWVLNANTGSFSGAVSGITTLAAGNTTITGFANATVSVNSALLTVGTSFIANTTGVYHTGIVNAASINIGGSGFIANSTAIVLGDPVTANGTTGTSGQVLVSNGTVGSPYWTTPTSISYSRYTSGFTATNLQGVIADTTGGSFTVTLPASPTVGNQVVIADGGNWGTNNLTVGRNGSTIEGLAEDLILNISGISVTFIYDGTTWEVYSQVGAGGGYFSGTQGNTTITGFANVSGTIQGGSSLTVAGALSGVTTAAMGNTTITGFANATVSVNSALLTVGTSFIANTTGAYHTGIVNAASINIGGSSFIANSTAVVVADPVTANGSTGTSGQVLTSNGSVGSPYWSTVAGVATGAVLQVVQAVKTDTQSFSTTYADVTGLSVTLTPAAASSKFLVSVVLNGYPSHYVGYGRILRNGTSIGEATAAGSRNTAPLPFSSPTSTDGLIITAAAMFLDSPNTTSSLTYKVQAIGRADGEAGGLLYLGRTVQDRNTATYDPRTICSITVMEIKG